MAPLILVFCGPTISHSDARESLDAVYLPPATQGSIVAAVLHYNPSVIVLIDGGFQTEPAVKHKEILWAISRGIIVVGASSMGALRAAELAPYMIGVGLIYRWYRRFALIPDDAIAVLHGPAELNFMAMTDALVDMRLSFRTAWRNRKISYELARKLEHSTQSLNFRDRTLARVVRDALPDASHNEREDCQAILALSFVTQKRRDALAALALVASGRVQRPNGFPAFVMTRAFANDLADSGMDMEVLKREFTTETFT